MSTEQPETRKRTAEEIEADLRRHREDLTRTVDEISGRLDPRRQVEEASDKLRGFVDDVKAGEPRAVQIVGAAAATVAAIVGLALLRRNR